MLWVRQTRKWGRKGSTGKVDPGLQAEDAITLVNPVAKK